MSENNYKVGDKVRVKSLDWYNTNKNSEGTIIFNGFRIFDEDMSKFCGKVVTIESYNSRWYYYDIKEDEKVNFWYDEMFEGPAIEEEPQEKMVSLKQVCEWLQNNIYFYVETKYDEDFRVDIEQLLNDIHKAM